MVYRRTPNGAGSPGKVRQAGLYVTPFVHNVDRGPSRCSDKSGTLPDHRSEQIAQVADDVQVLVSSCRAS